MVADQAVKYVKAVRAGGIDDGQPRRCGEQHAIRVQFDIGDMIGDQAFTGRQDLPLVAAGVKNDQAVSCGNGGAAAVGIERDAIDAVDDVVFDVGSAG